MTTIAFRVDSGVHIGNGHLIRCLTLANGFREMGAHCYFVCRPLKGALLDAVVDWGFEVQLLSASTTDKPITPEDPSTWLGVPESLDADESIESLKKLTRVDWLVVDHYALGHQWHKALRQSSCGMLVIDDLADRIYDCDVLLDQTYGRMRKEYQYRVNTETKLLLGSDYALLRSEFESNREIASKGRYVQGTELNILVSMGGTDPENISSKVVDAVEPLMGIHDLRFTVVLGENAVHKRILKKRLEKIGPTHQLMIGVKDMSSLLKKQDIAIGAAGTSSWERCCMGLPSIVIVTADNQHQIAKNLAEAGAINFLGRSQEVDSETIRKALLLWITDKNSLEKVRQRSLSICDGKGVERLINVMQSLH